MTSSCRSVRKEVIPGNSEQLMVRRTGWFVMSFRILNFKEGDGQVAEILKHQRFNSNKNTKKMGYFNEEIVDRQCDCFSDGYIPLSQKESRVDLA